MSHTDHGFKHGLLAALNRCLATSISSVTRDAQPETTQSASTVPVRIPKSLALEKYLAIPTFIRQGKTLGL